MRKRTIAIIAVAAVVLVLVGGMAFSRFGGGRGGQTTPVAEAASTLAAPVTSGAGTVDAKVIPVQSADLSLGANGIVAEVLVAEGDRVEAGQPLLRLESARQKAALAQAQAQLQRAEAQLAQAKSGAREQEIAAARAALDAAQARLDRSQQGENTAVAQASVAEAQAGLQKLKEGTSGDLLIAAETEVANAQARLRQAQSAYDKVSGLADIAARPESAQLEQATNALGAAQARLADLKRGASAADLAAAAARVRGAQAQVQDLQSTQPADLAAAQADVRQLKAQLDLVAAGARPEQIQALEADVAAAQAAVAQAEAALAETELKAPFAGAIATLDAKVGEQATTSKPVVQLADLGRWQIETSDLTEIEAVKVTPGTPVTITYDALPDLRQTGTVKLIRPIGKDNRGDIVYTVVVTPDTQDSRLLWNMTAVVTFPQES
jgi:multidrug efflux pump subunit AcrA (membrane-fusion protein)